VARSESVEVISKGNREAVRRSLHRLVRCWRATLVIVSAVYAATAAVPQYLSGMGDAFLAVRASKPEHRDNAARDEPADEQKCAGGAVHPREYAPH